MSKRVIKRIRYTLTFEGETLALPNGEFDDKTIEAEEANFLESAVDDIVRFVYGDSNTVQTSAEVIGTREEDDE